MPLPYKTSITSQHMRSAHPDRRRGSVVWCWSCSRCPDSRRTWTVYRRRRLGRSANVGTGRDRSPSSSPVGTVALWALREGPGLTRMQLWRDIWHLPRTQTRLCTTVTWPWSLTHNAKCWWIFLLPAVTETLNPLTQPLHSIQHKKIFTLVFPRSYSDVR